MRLNFRGLKGKIGQLRQIDMETMVSVVNDGILMIYALYITEGFLKMTTFRIRWPMYFHQILIIILVVLIIAKLVLIQFNGIEEIIAIMILAGVFLMAEMVSGYEIIKEVFLFILAMKEIPLKKILVVYLSTIVFLILVTTMSSQLGVIDNLIYRSGSRRDRWSFGVCYPTDYAAFFVWISFAWIALRKDRIRFWELFLISIMGLWVWCFCDARLSAIILILSVIMVLVVKIWQKSQKNMKYKSSETNYKRYRSGGKYRGYRQHENYKIFIALVRSVFCIAVPICAMAIIIFSYFYQPSNEWMQKLDALLSSRLSIGHEAFEQCDVTLFGQFIPMIGFGGSSLPWLKSAYYFFLDSSYMYILLCYGLFVFLVVICWWVYSSFLASQKKDYYLLVVIALIAIDCMVEHHMMELWYNPFFFFALSKKEVLGRMTHGKRKRVRHRRSKNVDGVHD